MSEKKKSPALRRLPVYREELVDFLQYLRSPVQVGGQSTMRGTKNRNERARLGLALDYLGIRQIFRDGRRSETGETKLSKIPKVQVVEISKDAIVYLLEIFTDMTNEEALRLMDFEDRLNDAQSDKWELPEEFEKIWEDQQKLSELNLADIPPAEPKIEEQLPPS
jgi:hypothetical protein